MSVILQYIIADYTAFFCSVSIIRLDIHIYVIEDYFEPEQQCQAYLTKALQVLFINLFAYLPLTLQFNEKRLLKDH